MNDARGRTFSVGERRLCFKGSGGEGGGGVGAAWRRSGRERGREGGGPGHGVEQRIGVAAAQPRRHGRRIAA
jgi:hypothetical protein